MGMLVQTFVRVLVAAIMLIAATARGMASPACDVALEALRASFPGHQGRLALDGMGNLQRVRIFLREAGPCLSKAYADNPADRCGWVDPNVATTRVRPPSRETLESLASAPIQDAARACPTLGRMSHAALGWTPQTSRSMRIKRDGLYDHTSVGITLPVVSASRGEAIAWVESQSGPLAGGGGFVLLRSDLGGRWRVAARFPGFVS